MGVRSFVVGQLGHPQGWFAPMIAGFMNRSNAGQNHHAVEALEVASDHTVLDAGFGGGVGLRLLLDRVTEGRVAGLDPSDAMLSRASSRFVDDLEDGRCTRSVMPSCCAGSGSTPNVRGWTRRSDDGSSVLTSGRHLAASDLRSAITRRLATPFSGGVRSGSPSTIARANASSCSV